MDVYDPASRALLGFGAGTAGSCRVALDADPACALARAGLAVSLYLNRRLDEGLSLAECAVALYPQEARAIHAIAHVLLDTLLAAALRAGEPERAQALLARRLAERRNPGHDRAAVGRRGVACAREGEAPA